MAMKRQDLVKVRHLVSWYARQQAKEKKTARWRTVWRSANSIVLIALLLGLLIVVNGIAAYKDGRMDLSETGRFTLAPQTRDLLAHLDQNVDLYAFVQKGTDEEKTANDLLQTYQVHSSRLTVHLLDPNQHPAQAKQFDVNQYGTVVVTTAKGRQARGVAVTEPEITSALLRSLREQGQSVYFLEGHGEHDLTDSGKDGYGQLRALLEQEGYTPKTVQLLPGKAIPVDAATLVIAGSKTTLLQKEVDQVQAYLERGGRLALFIDPQMDPGLQGLLAQWGITLGPGVVVDQEGHTFGGSYTLPLVTTYSVHDVVRDLKLPTLFPEARPLGVDLKNEHTALMPLAHTSGQSWSELDMTTRPVKFDSGNESRGPLTLAVAAAPRSMPSDLKHSPRMVVVGDSDFISNTYLNFSGNRDLFLNMINWLVQGLDSFTVRPQEVKVSPIILSEKQAHVLFMVPVVGLPLLITVTGWSVWRYRRTRK